jgi:hypothetical protein
VKNEMTRIFIAVAALAVLPLISRAGETVVRLNVRPMAAPKPALKYLLLPEVRELKPGNPVQYYLRCFAEQRNFFFSKQGVAQRARYQSMPLAELAKEKLRDYGGGALRQVDWAARLNAVDWEMEQRVQTEGMDLALPELGPLRVLTEALHVRFRIDVAAGRFDDAIRDAKTMFALARHLGEHPVEAANLTGLSLAERAVDTLEEMVQQKDCPNLYWPLTDLPRPLVDLRKGLQGSCTLVATELRPIRDDAVMTEEEMEKVVSRLSGVMSFAREQAGQAPRGLRVGLTARVKDAERVRAVRDRLFASRRAVLVSRTDGQETARAIFDHLLSMSYEKDLIQKFPPLQVILLDEKQEYENQCDEAMKLLSLAPWQIDALSGEKRERGGDGLFADLLPHVLLDRRTQGRLEQRIALLRHVEALRLYATGHDGKLPQKLSDIGVPLPVDPFTGKPFVYKLEGTIAHLRGSPPRGEENNSTYNIRYEVALGK